MASQRNIKQVFVPLTLLQENLSALLSKYKGNVFSPAAREKMIHIADIHDYRTAGNSAIFSGSGTGYGFAS
jgi:hypothetical protein